MRCNAIAAWLVAAVGASLTLPALAAVRAVVVLPLEAVKTDAKVADGVATYIQDAADQIENVRTLGLTPRVRKMVQTCRRSDLACLARAADRRGADIALVGRLEAKAAGLSLRLQAIETRRGGALAVAEELLAGDEKAVRAGVRRAVVQLLAPSRFTGMMTVGCNVPRAVIFVDDRARGTTPLIAPITGLPVGLHRVRVEKNGYDPYEAEIGVAFESSTHVEAVLLRQANTPPEPVAVPTAAASAPADSGNAVWFWPWALAGTGGVALAGAIGCGIASYVGALEVERRAKAQVLLFPHDAEKVERGRLLALAATGLYLVGGALAAVGIGFGVWDLVANDRLARPQPAGEARATEDDEWDQQAQPVTPAPRAAPVVPPVEDVPAAEPERPAPTSAPAEPVPTAPAAADPAAADLPEGDL